MKRILLFFLTVFLAASPCVLFVTCSKDQHKVKNSNTNGEAYNNSSAKVTANAVIAGVDARSCPCCGGYFLSIDNNKPIAGQYFLTYDFPAGYMPTSFPVKVYIEWEKDPNACINDKIIIKKLIKM